MAVRKLLKLDGGNDIVEMTTAEINVLKNRARYLYGADPSVTLSRVGSGGNLGTLNDTRLIAGAGLTGADGYVANFASEQTTQDVSLKTVGRAHISSTHAGESKVGDSDGRAFFCFYNNGSIQACDSADLLDTIIHPAIDDLVDGTDQPGTYRIHTSNSLSGHTLVNSNPVFSDTRADADLYTAGGIAETRDQPETIQNYYLFKTNNISAPSISAVPIRIDADANLVQSSTAYIDQVLGDMIKYTAQSSTDTYRIRYGYSSGNNRGTAMTDTKLNGSTYTTNLVNVNDYRAQEFPSGTAVTANTYNLKIRKA